jgi:hypothetical protein
MALDLRCGPAEAVVGVLEEDQPQYRERVLIGLKLRVGPQIVCSVPEPLFNLIVVARR